MGELERCSLELLDSLRRRDPRYLDHLLRRQELLRSTDWQALPEGELMRIRALGELALQESRAMHARAAAELSGLQAHRQMVAGLMKLGERYEARLDVKV